MHLGVLAVLIIFYYIFTKIQKKFEVTVTSFWVMNFGWIHGPFQAIFFPEILDVTL